MIKEDYIFKRNESDGTLLFVGGDLSGIQKFLYNISSKRAAVSLKGRSFYLQQFMENVVGKIKEQTTQIDDRFETVYSSGGKFYLIVPENPEIISILESVAKEAKEEVWKEHKGQLSINLSWASFTFNSDGTVNAKGATNQKIGYLWKLLTEDFTIQKNQKFKDLITETYSDFFEVKAINPDTRICAITGVEDDSCLPLGNEEDEEGIYVLPSVKQQVELGKSLRNVESFKNFEEYAGDSFLGILRMDIDGLGKRFINGFTNLDEYKAFSAKLDSFFQENLQKIRYSEEFKSNLTIIYAGGDDLFAVGLWSKIIDFAAKVRYEFVNYIGDDSITISGGVAIVKPKYPIAKAAEIAGEAEEAAKSFRNSEKNAFCIFGEVLSWKDEFDYVKSYKQQMCDLIRDFGMSRGILHKLMYYALIARKGNDYSYLWHATYYLTRYISRYKNQSEICKFCVNLRDKELIAGSRNYELLAIAARWTELELRTN